MSWNSKAKVYSAFIGALIALAGSGRARAAEESSIDAREPVSVIRAYLRAVYARDFAEAYRYISSEDQRARDLNQYLRQRGAFNGFALKASKMVAALVEIEASQKQVAPNRLLMVARYRAPDPEKLSALLRHWNGYQLNSLSTAEREQVIVTIEQQTRDGSLTMIQGEEKLILAKEGGDWRIVLNWAAGVTIPLQTIVVDPATIEVTLSRKQVVIQPGELFDIVLRIKNRSKQPVIARIGHIVEPKELADYLDFVQCGFLLPVKLPPELEQEYSGTYLLRGSLPEGVRRLSLTYDFRLDQAK
jgi:hypothetical protein